MSQSGEDEDKIPVVNSEPSNSDLISPATSEDTLLPDSADNLRIDRSLSDSELIRHLSTFQIPTHIMATNTRSDVFPPSLEFLNNNQKITGYCYPDNFKDMSPAAARLRLLPPEIVAYPVFEQVRKSVRRMGELLKDKDKSDPPVPKSSLAPSSSLQIPKLSEGPPPPKPPIPPSSDSTTTMMALMMTRIQADAPKSSLTGRKVNFAHGKPQVETVQVKKQSNVPGSVTNLSKKSQESVKTVDRGQGRKSGDTRKLSLDDGGPHLNWSKLDILSMIHALPMKKPYKKKSILLPKPEIEPDPVFEDDHLVTPLLETLQQIESTFKDYLHAIQESLDLLTFPCSSEYEPLSRIKGIFWVISRSARLIKSFDVRHDVDSVKKFIVKEAATLEATTKDFNKVIGQLVNEGKNTSQSKYKKPIKELVKVVQSVLEIKVDPEVIVEDPGPIYKTTIDPMTIGYYEKDVSVVDYEQLSIEMLWTPSLTFFRSFRGKDWQCLQKTETSTQVKILQATMQLVGTLFTEIKFILENSTQVFETKTTQLLQMLEKVYKPFKNASVSKVGEKMVLALQKHLTGFLEKRAEVNKLLTELKEGLKLISSVMPGVVDLAPLVSEELEEYLEREHHFCVPLCAFLPFCPRITNPFLFGDFQFMILRVPLSITLLINLFTSKSTRHSNNLVDGTMKIIENQQKVDFKVRRAMETQIQERRKSSEGKAEFKLKGGSLAEAGPRNASGDITATAKKESTVVEIPQQVSATNSSDSVFFSQPRPNVYNIGHIYARSYLQDDSVMQ